MMDHFTPRTAAGDGDKPGPLAWMPVAPSAGQLTDWANESNQLLALKHLGEHNEEVLAELGYTDTEIDIMKAKGVIGTFAKEEVA